jgi:hypothetical protein
MVFDGFWTERSCFRQYLFSNGAVNLSTIEVPLQLVDQRCCPTSEAYEKVFGIGVASNLVSEMLESFGEGLASGVLKSRVCASSVNHAGMNTDHDCHEVTLQYRKTKSRREHPRLSKEK